MPIRTGNFEGLKDRPDHGFSRVTKREALQMVGHRDLMIRRRLHRMRLFFVTNAHFEREVSMLPGWSISGSLDCLVDLHIEYTYQRSRHNQTVEDPP